MPAVLLSCLVAVAFVTGGCAPRLQEIGPDMMEPMLTDEAFVMPDGTALPLRRWLPQGDTGSDAASERGSEPIAVVLALHGFNDYSRAFEMPATAWAAQGIATYAYDQRGFGDTEQVGIWPGDARLMDDLDIAAGLLRDRYPDTPLFLLGESMGGAVVMAALDAPAPPRADGAVLIAPAVWGRDAQGPVASAALWFFAHTMPWMKMTGESFRVVPSDNKAMLHEMWQDPLVQKGARVDTLYGLVGLMDKSLDATTRLGAVPTLLLYGAREDVMPSDAVMEALGRLPPDRSPEQLRVGIYPAGYHMLLRDLAANAVWLDVAAWIEDRALPLPSGADLIARRVMNGEDVSLDEVATANGAVPAE